MIARLRGEVVESEPGRVVIDVNGVGYDVIVPARDQPTGIATVLVHTDVRQDAIVLYGFVNADDREAFTQLRKVDGVGPAKALAVLSAFTVGELAAAVNAGDHRALARIPGIGKRIADRFVLELKDKLVASGPGPARPAPTVDDTFALAMAQLGYKKSEIDAAAGRLADTGQADAPLPTRITAALAFLARPR